MGPVGLFFAPDSKAVSAFRPATALFSSVSGMEPSWRINTGWKFNSATTGKGDQTALGLEDLNDLDPGDLVVHDD
jgi:hypothetical protein